MTTEIITRVDGAIGHIVLNRPQAINALSLMMILAIHRILDDWRADKNILAVVISGAGEKGFCSGGDIRSIYAARDNPDFGYDIFKAEYTLNYKIFCYPKPFLALMHGITMGGGAGVSVYASRRIVCANSKFAMPECGIGLFPDIGASWFFNQLPGYLGRWLAITGHGIDAADCLFTGIATHYISQNLWPNLLQELAQITDIAAIDTILSRHHRPPEQPGILAKKQGWITDHFGYDNIQAIAAHLPHSEHALMSRQYLQKNSPTSMTLTFAALARARGQDLRQVLMTDLLLSQQCLRRGEFYEGIRAAVIDKDRSPRWSPADLAAIDPAAIDSHFLPLPGIECAVFDAYPQLSPSLHQADFALAK